MLSLPAFAPLMLMMALPIAESQTSGMIMPTFDLMKFWNCYMELMSNPYAAMADPGKVWNKMMCGWEMPSGSSPSDDKTKTPETKPADAGTPPKLDVPALRQGDMASKRIDISPEAALALALFRKEHAGEYGNSAADVGSGRSHFPVPFSHIPSVQSSQPSPLQRFNDRFNEISSPTFAGAGFSPFVSQPFFYALPLSGHHHKKHKEDSPSSEEDEDRPKKPHNTVGPGPVIVTSHPYAVPYVPRPPQAVFQNPRPRTHHNIIVNQRGDGQQTLLTNGGGYGSSESISVIQT